MQHIRFVKSVSYSLLWQDFPYSFSPDAFTVHFKSSWNTRLSKENTQVDFRDESSCAKTSSTVWPEYDYSLALNLQEVDIYKILLTNSSRPNHSNHQINLFFHRTPGKRFFYPVDYKPLLRASSQLINLLLSQLSCSNKHLIIRTLYCLLPQSWIHSDKLNEFIWAVTKRCILEVSRSFSSVLPFSTVISLISVLFYGRNRTLTFIGLHY